MKKVVLFSLFAVVVTAFQFCHSTKSAQSAVTRTSYASNVQPIIQANCSPCHIPPQGRAKALNTYDAAKANIDNILTRINRNPDEKGFMPMKHPKLPDSTIAVFARWKEAGLPE
jgi:hypothetical protein